MMPAMCGLAIEVPEIVRVWLPAWKPDGSDRPVQPAATMQVCPVCTEVMLRPGAATSGFSRSGVPRMRRGPRDEKLARVSAPFCPSRVALTGGVAMMVFLIELPSTMVTSSVGMVIGVTIAGSSAMPGGGEPGALLTMITPMAPAFMQFSVLVLKLHVPRLATQILPEMAAALVRAQQASLGSAPQGVAGAVGSTAMTASAVCPVGAGPKAAAPPR